MLTLLLTGCLSGAVSAQVIDAWHYTGVADGTALNDSSCASTGLVGGAVWVAKPIVVVSNEMQRWESDGANNSYVNVSPTYPRAAGATDGKFEFSYDVFSADFSNTALSNGTAFLGYGVRGSVVDNAGVRIRYNGSFETNVVAGVTNVVDQDEIQIQVFDEVSNWATITNLPGHTLNNLHIKMVYDLNNRGSAGSFEAHTTLNGAALIDYSGQISATFSLNYLRQSVAAGADWQIGDVVLVDNLVLDMIETASAKPQMYGTIEEWNFNTEADGTVFPHLINTAPAPYGAAVWAGVDKVGTVITNDLFHLTAPAKIYSSSTISQPYQEAGEYTLSFLIKAADLSSATAKYGKVLLGFRDSSLNKDLFTVFITQANGTASVKATGSSTVKLLDLVNAQISNLALRVVVNLDTDTMNVYYTKEGEAEVLASENQPLLQADMLFDQVRLVVAADSGKFGTTDFVDIDDVKVSGPDPVNTPTSLYDDWTTSFPSLSDTNMEVDADGDGVANLTEYAFGGDPSDPASKGTQPSRLITENGGTNYLQYIYVERTDAADRGITSVFEMASLLVPDTWTNAVGYETGRGPAAEAGFNAVTNQVPMTGDTGFIRLNIQFTP